MLQADNNLRQICLKYVQHVTDSTGWWSYEGVKRNALKNKFPKLNKKKNPNNWVHYGLKPILYQSFVGICSVIGMCSIPTIHFHYIFQSIVDMHFTVNACLDFDDIESISCVLKCVCMLFAAPQIASQRTLKFCLWNYVSTFDCINSSCQN